MKRLQIMIDEDLNQALEQLAQETGRSKATLIREILRERLRPLPPLSVDALSQLMGSSNFEPAPVDDIVYK